MDQRDSIKWYWVLNDRDGFQQAREMNMDQGGKVWCPLTHIQEVYEDSSFRKGLSKEKVAFPYHLSYSVFSYLLCAGFILRILLVLNWFKLIANLWINIFIILNGDLRKRSYLAQQNTLVSGVWWGQAGQTQSLSLWILPLMTFLSKGCICSPVVFSNAYGYFSCHNFELLLTWSG